MKPVIAILNNIKYVFASTDENLKVEESAMLSEMLGITIPIKPFHWFNDLETVVLVLEERFPGWSFLVRSPFAHEQWQRKYYARMSSPDYVGVPGENGDPKTLSGISFVQKADRPGRALMACIITAMIHEAKIKGRE